MKNNIRLLCFFVFSFLTYQITFAQKIDKAFLLNQQKNIYKNALKYGDFLVARQSTYNILSLNPSEKNWRDTLSFLYLGANDYAQAIAIAKEVTNEQPNNQGMWSVLATAYVYNNNAVEALNSYEKLYALTKKVEDLYQIASLQYAIARVSECELSIQKVMAHPDLEKATMNVVFNNTAQQVPLKAAALNIMGAVKQKMNQPEESRQFFEAALKIFPDFNLAKGNLEALKQENTKGAKQEASPNKN